MRAFIFILTGIVFCAFALSVKAEPAPYAPWQDTHPQEIAPLPLSIDDLEKPLREKEEVIDSRSHSRLEDLYSQRTDEKLTQFGYDLFPSEFDPTKNVGVGAVQDTYILHVGDALKIIRRGQINDSQMYPINKDGMLIADELLPVMAAGLTLGQVKKQLLDQAQDLHNTQLFVSLATLRQINITVIGHVKKPGSQHLTAFHSVYDALSAAGGIDKNGSLRQIKLIRQGKTHKIDLYQLFMIDQGQGNMMLHDGDRLIVPPVGSTIAVSGYVKRPGIYEIMGAQKLSLHQVLNLAGGALTPGNQRYLKLAFTHDGYETTKEIGQPARRVFGNGSVLSVIPAAKKRQSTITLSGSTREKGIHDLTDNPTLAALLSDEKILGQDVYPLIGIIQRHNKKSLSPELIAFSPYQILNKENDITLQDNDAILLFSRDDIKYMAQDTSHQNEAITPIIESFLSERSVFIRGAVRQEGAYPVANLSELSTLISVAGGIALEADTSDIEITSRDGKRRYIDIKDDTARDLYIQAGDTVRVNQKFNKIAKQTVTILGEVHNPGDYDLVSGDTLSLLLYRAGGLTDNAYPQGTIFSRRSERIREESRYKAQAQDLQMKLAVSMQQVDDDKKPNMAQIASTESLISRLNNAKAVGRITVEAHPDRLSAEPELDLLLEHGDKIYIPKRPGTVRVAGEVLSPAALLFRSGKKAHEYIREAGGTTYYADKDRTFVIYPNGSANPLQISAWNHTPEIIPPGSTIIVPRDPKPFDFLESAERVSQILANLAISGLYVEAIGDD